MASLREIIGKFIGRFFGGIIRKPIRIFRYEVRVSGYVEPPSEVKRKPTEPKSAIQFELSFEGVRSDYFRTMIDKPEEAEKRYDKELRELVREQELVAISLRSPRAGKISLFSWRVAENVEEVERRIGKRRAEKLITEFLESATAKEESEFKRKGIIKINLRPKFVITAMSFEPVDFIDVPADRIVEGMADDRFVFKLYRSPADAIEDNYYASFDGVFTHELA